MRPNIQMGPLGLVDLWSFKQPDAWTSNPVMMMLRLDITAYHQSPSYIHLPKRPSRITITLFACFLNGRYGAIQACHSKEKKARVDQVCFLSSLVKRVQKGFASGDNPDSLAFTSEYYCPNLVSTALWLSR